MGALHHDNLRTARLTARVRHANRAALRWLGFVKTQHEQPPSLKLFAHPLVGEWTQAWLEKLRGLGLKASTLAVYTNGVISVCGYALTLVEQPEACPTEQLINLRRQAESIAKQVCCARLLEACRANAQR